MVAAKEDSNTSPPQGSPEDSKGDHLQTCIQPSTNPSNSDTEHTVSIEPPLQQPAVVDNESLANAALANAAFRAATEAASVALKEDPEGISILDQDSVSVPQNQIPVTRPQHTSATPLSQSSPLDTTVLLNETSPTVPFSQKMDIHDATGTILHQLGVNGDADGVQQPPQPSDPSAQNQQPPQNQHPNQPAPGSEVAQGDGMQPPQQPQQPSVPQQQQSVSASKQVVHQSQTPIAAPMNAQRKPTRMPGTKQCPSCQNTIAAALAKCPKCPHVFREKKEKVKRSGKRGKKNCPKCSFENPSACSSCKNCKYVFRLKLMDKYKQMRPRQTSDTAAAAAAAAAHAAANIGSHHAGVTAVSTVPMQAGVASYPNTVAQPMHPGHAVSVIPPLSQHPMSLHPHTHNVHATGVPQMHPLPQHHMPHHQPHPQL